LGILHSVIVPRHTIQTPEPDPLLPPFLELKSTPSPPPLDSLSIKKNKKSIITKVTELLRGLRYSWLREKQSFIDL
jgi:hypothetical protein